MLEFAIANLVVPDSAFKVQSTLGVWEFEQAANYSDLLDRLDKGQCANTFYASHAAITPKSSDSDFVTACQELIDICLVFSFLNARCVTPSNTTGQSDIQFIELGDDFIRARAIDGFNPLSSNSITDIFVNWLSATYPAYTQRKLRLQLSHWLSGLTCFSLEDLFLSAGVQMDIVKHRERTATGNLNLTYFQGMTYASTRYGLTPLGDDYKKMRNDIVHEGVLSGTNFAGKSKQECAVVAADTLNWLDNYILAVMGVAASITNLPRWCGRDIECGLPAISVR